MYSIVSALVLCVCIVLCVSLYLNWRSIIFSSSSINGVRRKIRFDSIFVVTFSSVCDWLPSSFCLFCFVLYCLCICVLFPHNRGSLPAPQ